jgi:hypothetical protein
VVSTWRVTFLPVAVTALSAGVVLAADDPLVAAMGSLALLGIVMPAAWAVVPRGRRWTAVVIAAGPLAALVIDEWMLAVVMLVWAGMLMGVTSLLTPSPARSGIGIAAVVLLATAWLAWPIWLAPNLVTWGIEPPTWSTTLHPAFAINRAMDEAGILTERPTFYRLTPLGQDLAYALPTTPWPSVVLHGVIGLVAAGGRVALDRHRLMRHGNTPA